MKYSNKLISAIEKAWLDSVTEPDNRTFCPVRLTWLVSFVVFMLFSFKNPPVSQQDLLLWVQSVGVVMGAGGITAAIKDRAGANYSKRGDDDTNG